ncbi:patatin-like phospholipase family protein [Actinosynnema sp. NPDC047251]|uniref:Patatin-like phospholipase n=1 Tax=Saccharothrix espanaensis (strain ATCC 51144 / DSM 44229 / JCM 9112 / NBRC 15066 / NRRL 15764) TaxID=1179773 RepID=K0KBR5_SACES|nr:patatin-like phospholipase family protein [Saccharothrix espanaensis]CCH34274.1 Patatin-like phospholipase [Saccharothrix espanaensis DSM 44229]
MADEQADEREEFNRYCDVTMRGGTTSGVVYPWAVVELARHYRFRSLGGASAGAIAAAFTAAAEKGRERGGFDRLAETIRWFAAPGWRMAQLFQPAESTRKLYRIVAASMQSRGTTGRSATTCLILALLGAIGFRAKAALALAVLLWLVGPVAWFLAVDWGGTPTWLLVGVIALVAVAVPPIVVRLRPRRRSTTSGWSAWARRLGTALLLVVPLVPVLVAMSWRLADFASLAVAVVWWLVLGFACLSAVALTYLLGAKRFLDRMATKVHFGLVPGTGTFKANFWDRRCGVPASTGVPPIAEWFTTELDELSGVTDLKFSHLTTNLVLMTTDLSEGRPYRLPFTEPAAPWLYCERCLEYVVPQRVVRAIGGAETGHRCPLHPEDALRDLPADLPVALAVRMSMPLPGLIAAVPLCRAEPLPRVHWFSDGGITSNFPIHFFDTLLPRWPTFGLTLGPYPGPDAPPVWLPEQDAATSGTPWSEIGGVGRFAASILNTMLDWRDTMQSALPGYRGRIAQVRLADHEGGTNLFMRPETILALAERGRAAGELLRTRFTADDAADTDRYRWIRMRLAMREYQQLGDQARRRSELYKDLAEDYPIPEDLKDWFEVPPGGADPNATDIALILDALGAVGSARFDGEPPVDPDLRLSPPE